jgi:hypothetical protein
VPAAVAFLVRWFVNESERWQQVQNASTKPVALRELFDTRWRRVTLVASSLAFVALITWWSCNAFIATMVTGWAHAEALARSLTPAETLVLVESWKFTATFCFNAGGLIGTLLTIPIAEMLGRRWMFAIYFVASTLSILVMFGLTWSGDVRLYLYFFIGLFVFGVCGAFTYYLPELFTTRVRATGAGFSFNIGRVIAAAGPYVVGAVAAGGHATGALLVVGLIPLLGLCLLPLAPETRGQTLRDR